MDFEHQICWGMAEKLLISGGKIFFKKKISSHILQDFPIKKSYLPLVFLLKK